MTKAIENTHLTETIIGLEKAALDQWYKGDPSGFLELSAQDVVYFDPYIEKRIDGLEALTAHYEPLKGKGSDYQYDFINPLVQAVDNMAVFTFNLVAKAGDNINRWNCTEVYRKEDDGNWKIIQTHWSLTTPELEQQ